MRLENMLQTGMQIQDTFRISLLPVPWGQCVHTCGALDGWRFATLNPGAADRRILSLLAGLEDGHTAVHCRSAPLPQEPHRIGSSLELEREKEGEDGESECLLQCLCERDMNETPALPKEQALENRLTEYRLKAKRRNAVVSPYPPRPAHKKKTVF